MSDAPERLTLRCCTACGACPIQFCMCDIEEGECVEDVEYIRADIHDAEVARLRRALCDATHPDDCTECYREADDE